MTQIMMIYTVNALATATKPNFVFMLADDWGWGDVGVYGANDQSEPLKGTNIS
jgi:arylsulfatase A-like enzyme